MHPSDVLFQDLPQPVFLPVCDHYAGSEKLMQKSVALQNELGPVFDITLDCEDGAATGNESEHAQLIAKVLTSDDNVHHRLGVRVHNTNSHFFEEDVRLILSKAAQQVAYIVLPKVKTANEVAQASARIQSIAELHGRYNLPIHVLIETHDALANVQEIAALPAVECLSFGIMDFISSHNGAIPANAMRAPGQFAHPLVVRAKLDISAAAHRFGKTPSHNVTTEFKDSANVAYDATRACLEYGYTRMWSIHPNQIRPIIKAMSPRNAEIHEAINILSAAQQEHWGPTQLNGRLHDRASYRYFWYLLKRAQVSQMTLPEGAQQFL
jgi:citrate lyase subunit beta / citryl-CoA lyase